MGILHSIIARLAVTAAAYQRLPAATIKLLKRGREEYFAKDDVEAVLKIMPVIPKGEFIGDMSAHQCHANAMKVRQETGAEVYLGFCISAPNSFFRHSFNVVDGKVEEHTKLKKFDKYTYVGVPVPASIKAPTAKYVDRLHDLEWVKAQVQRFKSGAG